jgi:hypothetical protein
MIHCSNWSPALKEEPAGVANCPIQGIVFLGYFSLSIVSARNNPSNTSMALYALEAA